MDGMNDYGTYRLRVDPEREVERFADVCSCEIEALRRAFKDVKILWGAVVWGEL